MVSARRIDAITRREFPLRNTTIRRDPLRHQRFLRDRQPVSREIYIDREDIPVSVQQAVDDRANVSYNLQFAPLVNDTSTSSFQILNSEGEEPNDDSTSLSGISDCPTVEVDLDNPTVRIPVGLLLAFERNGEIPASGQVRYRPSPPSSPRTPDYTPPSYSPIPFGDISDILDVPPSPFSSIQESSDDEAINRILDFLSSDEFLNSVGEP